MKLFATSILWLLMLSLFPSFLFAQPALNYKLQLLEPGKWGVFVKPDNTINPSLQTITGSAQATVVMPLNFAWNSLQSVHGNWTMNAPLHGPIENPTRSYFQFGLSQEYPHIDLIAGQETLLFTFKMTGQVCPDSMYLINNLNDPFLPPNSYNSNPGNEMTVFDPIGFGIYEYKANYSPSAWSCHDCDGDGILNAFEDTDGDGKYDPFNEDVNGDGHLDVYEDINGNGLLEPSEDLNGDGFLDMLEDTNNNGLLDLGEDLDNDGVLDLVNEDVDGDGYLDPDVSQLCNPCSPYHIESALLIPIDDYADFTGDSVFFAVNLTGGWSPYTINWTDGNSFHSTILYKSGSPIGFAALQTGQISLVSVSDSFNCVVDTNLIGTMPITINPNENNPNSGIVSYTVHPTTIIICSDSPAFFAASATISSDSFSFGWQISADNGLTWVDIDLDSAPFYHTLLGKTTAGTDTLFIINVLGLNNYQFRAVANSQGNLEVYSNAAELEIEGPLAITQNPVNFTNCTDSEATFYAKVTNPTNGQVFKHWQYKSPVGDWTDITQATQTVAGNIINFGGYDGDTLLISPVTGLNDYLFRCNFWTATCNLVTSSSAKLNVEGPIFIIDQPDNVSVCGNGSAIFTLTVENASNISSIKYKWQKLTAGAWTDLINSAPFSGVSTNHLIVSPTSTLYNAKFRCVVSTNSCNYIYSDIATITQEDNIAIIDQTEDMNICAESPAFFSVGFSNNCNSPLSLHWQYKTPNGAWLSLPTNIGSLASLGAINPNAPNANWQGAFSQDLNISNADGLEDWKFRLTITTPYQTIYTDEVTIQIIDICDGACDIDGDGITNSVDSDSPTCGHACVKLKLQLLPDSSGWAVMAKPFGAYVPSANAAVTGGRITVVAPANFVLDGFSSVAGNWSPTNVQTNIPGHPGRKYITFELTNQQSVPLPLNLNLATSLFQFEKTGDCPDSLYILENFNGSIPNFLSGQDPAYTEGFELCGVYSRKNWRCHTPTNTPGGIIIFVAEEDFGGAPQTGTGKFGNHFPEGKSFTAYPNPAGEYVNIFLSENMTEGQNTLALWDLHGRRLQEVLMENANVQLDLSSLPAGVYFISLAQNGHIVERKELIKK